MGVDVRKLLPGVALAGVMALAFFLMAPTGQTQATAKAGTHVSSISVTPGSASPLDVVSINTTLTNDGSATEGVGVVMLVRDGTGQNVLQEKQTGISLASHNDLAVYWTWRIPGRLTSGPYSVQMSVVDEGGNVLAADTLSEAFTVAGRAGR